MANQTRSDAEPTAEDRFRSALEDAVMILKKLAPKFGSVSDMAASMELALTNDGQLQLLMDIVTPLRMRSS